MCAPGGPEALTEAKVSYCASLFFFFFSFFLILDGHASHTYPRVLHVLHVQQPVCRPVAGSIITPAPVAAFPAAWPMAPLMAQSCSSYTELIPIWDNPAALTPPSIASPKPLHRTCPHSSLVRIRGSGMVGSIPVSSAPCHNNFHSDWQLQSRKQAVLQPT